jgi:chemotaxis protein methyltransferase CheR
MIYFNKSTQTDVVAKLAAKLEPGGYLFIGHSESLSGMNHTLKYVKPAVYRKSQ